MESIDITEANWLPVVRAFIERIELQSTIDQLVPGKTAGSASQVVMGLVMDALSGRLAEAMLSFSVPMSVHWSAKRWISPIIISVK